MPVNVAKQRQGAIDERDLRTGVRDRYSIPSEACRSCLSGRSGEDILLSRPASSMEDGRSYFHVRTR
jgi:hypothetical protein